MDKGYWSYNGIRKFEKKKFKTFYQLVGSSLLPKANRYVTKHISDYNIDLELIRILEKEAFDRNKIQFAIYHDKSNDEGYVSLYAGGMLVNANEMFVLPINMTADNKGKIIKMCENLGGELHEITEISNKYEGEVCLKKVTLLDLKLVIFFVVSILALSSVALLRMVFL
ncbi:hypothetical protein [Vibrio mediterranei]|uniref:Uncharacterized protein n=1 Tax=Vibrio mediterranei TaxID=689 RepID=A0A3G4V8B4_9VIBR|nr:hypothetical protein [Vibrio mediterranei]AYV21017.1 hypothetical protein ECB94_06690 [Vibrio mediterranei]